MLQVYAMTGDVSHGVDQINPDKTNCMIQERLIYMW